MGSKLLGTREHDFHGHRPVNRAVHCGEDGPGNAGGLISNAFCVIFKGFRRF